MEYLNESARKAKRNLWFFALICWALALGAVRPGTEGAVPIGAFGLETELKFVLAALALLLVFNLVNLALHVTYSSLVVNKNRMIKTRTRPRSSTSRCI